MRVGSSVFFFLKYCRRQHSLFSFCMLGKLLFVLPLLRSCAPRSSSLAYVCISPNYWRFSRQVPSIIIPDFLSELMNFSCSQRLFTVMMDRQRLGDSGLLCRQSLSLKREGAQNVLKIIMIKRSRGQFSFLFSTWCGVLMQSLPQCLTLMI